MLPTSDEYQEAITSYIHIALRNDAELREAKPIRNRRGFATSYAGNFAIAFALETERPEKKRYAVRCFTKEIGSVQRRYEEIGKALKRLKPEAGKHFVRMEYVRQEEGIIVKGKPYSYLKMEWIDGKHLKKYLVERGGKVEESMARQFYDMIVRMQEEKIAHGDLQPGNIMVDSKNMIRLIDYDGMYVPALKGYESVGMGMPGYQHPGRRIRDFDEKLDSFGGTVVYLSLLTLAKEKDVYQGRNGQIEILGKGLGEEDILLGKEDYLNPSGSRILGWLKKSKEEEIRFLAGELEKVCKKRYEEIPLFVCICDERIYYESLLKQIDQALSQEDAEEVWRIWNQGLEKYAKASSYKSQVVEARKEIDWLAEFEQTWQKDSEDDERLWSLWEKNPGYQRRKSGRKIQDKAKAVESRRKLWEELEKCIEEQEAQYRKTGYYQKEEEESIARAWRGLQTMARRIPSPRQKAKKRGEEARERVESYTKLIEAIVTDNDCQIEEVWAKQKQLLSNYQTIVPYQKRIERAKENLQTIDRLIREAKLYLGKWSSWKVALERAREAKTLCQYHQEARTQCEKIEKLCQTTEEYTQYAQKKQWEKAIERLKVLESLYPMLEIKQAMLKAQWNKNRQKIQRIAIQATAAAILLAISIYLLMPVYHYQAAKAWLEVNNIEKAKESQKTASRFPLSKAWVDEGIGGEMLRLASERVQEGQDKIGSELYKEAYLNIGESEVKKSAEKAIVQMKLKREYERAVAFIGMLTQGIAWKNEDFRKKKGSLLVIIAEAKVLEGKDERGCELYKEAKEITGESEVKKSAEKAIARMEEKKEYERAVEFMENVVKAFPGWKGDWREKYRSLKEKERQEKERQEKERQEKERQEKERQEKERQEKERQEKERQEKERQEKERCGIPEMVWERCRYENKGEWILDMTAEEWEGYSVRDQQKYARIYQEGYAKKRNLEVEKKRTKKGAEFEFMLIPPGRFWMGSPGGEKDRDSDEERHRVIISKEFYMQKTEITQEQWRKVTGERPWSKQYGMEENDRHAAAYISWNDIKRKMLPEMGEEFGLPTEAQWEYACRAGTTARFYWGESESEIGEYANSDCGNDRYTYIAPVGSFKANAFSLYDMSGNVWEWCEDMHANYTGEDMVDPCNQSGSHRVDRGGSWINRNVWGLRSADRSGDIPSRRSNYLGARFFLRS